MTGSQRTRDRPAMMSSVIPSEKYPCSGWSLILLKGRTAMAGRSSNVRPSEFPSPSCGATPVFDLSHASYETKSLSGECLYEPLLFAAVTEGLSYSVDSAIERCVRYDATVPDLLDYLVPADHPLAMFDQVVQQIEYLRLQRDNGFSVLSELPAFLVEIKRFERVQHGCSPMDADGVNEFGRLKANQAILKVR